MATIDDLDRKLSEKLAVIDERRQLKQEHLEQIMSEVELRHQRYTALADQLMQTVIRPRMEKLKSHFANSRVEATNNSRHTACLQFDHTERFPATASLCLGITRDGEVRTVTLECKFGLLPVFFRYQDEDRCSMPLDDVDAERVAAWVDEKILYFVDTYLKLETIDIYQDQNFVSCPVCGMRVNKAFAVAQTTFRDVTFYFCVEQCRARFAENPEKYS